VQLKTSGAQGTTVYWFINGQLLYHVAPDKLLKHQFRQVGHYQIAVTDEMGKTASIEVDVSTAIH